MQLATLGTPEVFIVGMILLPFALVIWAVVHAASQPQAAWGSIGKSRGMWITILLVGLFFFGVVGLILAIIYLVSVRPKLDAAVRADR